MSTTGGYMLGMARSIELKQGAQKSEDMLSAKMLDESYQNATRRINALRNAILRLKALPSITQDARFTLRMLHEFACNNLKRAAIGYIALFKDDEQSVQQVSTGIMKHPSIIKMIEDIIKYVPDLNNKTVEALASELYEQVKLPETKQEFAFDLLIDSIRAGDVKEIESLLQEGIVDINMIDQYGCTALHYAVCQNDQTVLDLLLKQKKLLLNIVNNDGQAALILAPSPGCYKFMQKRGAIVCPVDAQGNSALHRAAMVGNESVVGALCCDYQESACHENNQGMTPLMLASQRYHAKVVNILANINWTEHDAQGRTPYLTILHMQKMADNKGLFGALVTRLSIQYQQLLAEGKDGLNTIGSDGLTPLMAAVKAGNIEVVQDILGGARYFQCLEKVLNTQNKKNKTALLLAREHMQRIGALEQKKISEIIKLLEVAQAEQQAEPLQAFAQEEIEVKNVISASQEEELRDAFTGGYYIVTTQNSLSRLELTQPTPLSTLHERLTYKALLSKVREVIVEHVGLAKLNGKSPDTVDQETIECLQRAIKIIPDYKGQDPKALYKKLYGQIKIDRSQVGQQNQQAGAQNHQATDKARQKRHKKNLRKSQEKAASTVAYEAQRAKEFADRETERKLAVQAREQQLAQHVDALIIGREKRSCKLAFKQWKECVRKQKQREQNLVEQADAFRQEHCMGKGLQKLKQSYQKQIQKKQQMLENNNEQNHLLSTLHNFAANQALRDRMAALARQYKEEEMRERDEQKKQLLQPYRQKALAFAYELACLAARAGQEYDTKNDTNSYISAIRGKSQERNAYMSQRLAVDPRAQQLQISLHDQKKLMSALKQKNI